MASGEFSIVYVSDVDKEHLAVEVHFRGQRLFGLDRERGEDSVDLEFYSDIYRLPAAVRMKFPLEKFQQVMADALEAVKSTT